MAAQSPDTGTPVRQGMLALAVALAANAVLVFASGPPASHPTSTR